MMGGYVNLDGSDVGDSSMNGASQLQLEQGKQFASLHSNQHGGQNMLPTNSTMNTSMNPSMNASMNPSMNASMNPSMNASMPPMNASMPQMNSSMNASMPQMNSSMPQMNKPMMGGEAPVGDQGLLDSSLRGAGHLAPLDRAFDEIAGMKDQGGGARRKHKKRSSKRSSKRKARSTKRGGRRSTKKGKKRSTRRRRSMRGGEAPVDSPDMLLNGGQAQNAVNGMNPEWKLAEDASAFNPRS
jgi:hypothetical protein